MPHAHEPPTGRDETKEEQADRKWGELLQEVRVAQTGIQILLAFLLTSAFSPRFPDLDPFGKDLYVFTIMCGAGATGALIAPVTLHRMVTGYRLKPQTVVWASRFTMVGLVLLLVTVGAALALILRFVMEDTVAVWLASAVLLWFAGCWFLPAAWLRHKRRELCEGPGDTDVKRVSDGG
ncbi:MULTISPECIES: DUF6328 family protein [Streptomyces]|uniref:Uncharacterized protein n=2 Tax=Streptomyces TaxID=1883 RepID=A0A3R7IYF6_9ACTN|nr:MULTISPECIES: DUF6328 family protein [Streptomyces]KNE79164.1 membrane protein [Streptomyces fradiae]OFA57656.1 hypothetical protein BEN35_05350 [Streptomyces fradiae]PQM23774.1 hypothetical protein Sfr7A_09155 [Streptomyces xinghaiensis]RKM91763.1 hypothetical protein SFRA_027675 [Streptomyces xinghaiensis]RNC73467.1 hypothetical protein DC095_015275 [Streptomyces xinghaiensis]